MITFVLEVNSKIFVDFNDWEASLLSNIDRGLKFGRSLGIDALELYLTNSRSLNIKIKSGMIDGTQGGNIGVGCRCVTGKKVGFASASGITDTAVNFAVESAFKVSKTLTKEDERWTDFVQTSEKGKDGRIDDSVLEISSEEVVNGANLIFKEAKEYDSRVLSMEGMITVGYGAFAVGNTEGLSKSSRTTFGLVQAEFVAVEDNKSKMGVNIEIGRGVPKFEGFGRSGAAKAVKFLDSIPLNQTGQMNVVFNNLAAAQLIWQGLFNSVNGQSVVEGRSSFAKKINTQVGAPIITIYDDAQIPEDPNMVAIDDEGYPHKKTLIMEKGVLKSFIFDHYYSQICSTENTGNAKRRGPQTYESLPFIAPTTISIVPGKKDLEGLTAEIENGILATDLLMGMGHSDIISGDFSIVAPNCYKIENREITKPIEPITIAGNLYKAFNQIIAISNETELTPFGKIPSIAFEGFTVSG
ncbi:MAG: TldD/PmbA family protein [Promethearchaeota archaeon]